MQRNPVEIPFIVHVLFLLAHFVDCDRCFDFLSAAAVVLLERSEHQRFQNQFHPIGRSHRCRYCQIRYWN